MSSGDRERDTNNFLSYCFYFRCCAFLYHLLLLISTKSRFDEVYFRAKASRKRLQSDTLSIAIQQKKNEQLKIQPEIDNGLFLLLQLLQLQPLHLQPPLQLATALFSSGVLVVGLELRKVHYECPVK